MVGCAIFSFTLFSSLDLYSYELKQSVLNERPGPVAEWLTNRTHDPMIASSSLTGASNILGQNRNLVIAPQCCLSRCQQFVAPEVNLRQCTLHSPPQCE